MKKYRTDGMTLVELIIVVVISGIMALTIGILMARSFESWKRAADKVVAENDVRYFHRKLEYQFRSATTHHAEITPTNDVLRFATYLNYNLSGQYTQNEYRVDSSSNLVRQFWDASVDALGNINPSSPWSTPATHTETIMPNVVSLRFEWVGIEPTISTSAVKVTVLQSKPLPNGAVYISSTAFTVKSRNRGK
jgi:prepilin-type N-terminal cleavage/methylation domain-containing protein